jgi:outer membrane protein
MRNIFKTLIITAALTVSSNLFAASDIAVVNLTQVFQQVPQGQPAFAKIQKKYAPQANQLQNQQNALNKKIQAFQAQQANLPTDQRNAQQASLVSQQQQLQNSINAYQATLRQNQQQLLTAFGNSMKVVVDQISKANGYHLVLSSQTAIYNDSTVDITPQVIAAMKKNS